MLFRDDSINALKKTAEMMIRDTFDFYQNQIYALFEKKFERSEDMKPATGNIKKRDSLQSNKSKNKSKNKENQPISNAILNITN